MSLQKKFTFLSTLAAGLVPTAQAADAAPVVISATRTAQIADAALAPVIVIGRDTIERSNAVDVADLLRFHAGIDIGRNGGPGQSTSVFIRGTESNHTLVMIDGVKINPGTVGGAALHNLAPEIVERIEIVKGPRSTLYGSEAIGGVINIITRRASDDTQGRFGFGAGSYDTRTLNVGVHHGRDGTRIGFDAHRYSTDGYALRPDVEFASGHDKTTFNGYVGDRAGPLDWELSHWQATGNTEYLSFFLSPLDLDFTNSTTALTLKGAPHALWNSTLRVSQVVDETVQNQSDDFSETRRYQFDWQNDVQIDARQLLTTGLWYSQEDTSASVFGSGFDEQTDVAALYAQDDIRFGDHRLLLAARHTRHESFGGHTSWDVEYGYRVTARTRITAAVGTAFRAPDATDRYGFGGNPDLEPETARNVELGVRHALGARQTLALNAFDNRIDDLIEFADPDGFLGPTPGRMENVEQARIRGVELGYTLDLRPFALRVEGIVQDPENETTGEPLPRRAQRSLTGSFDYDVGAYRFGIDFIAQSRRKDSAFSTAYNAGYGLVNLSAQWRLAQGWSLSGRVENLFDKEYELADGFNTTGRSVMIEARYRPGA